MVRIETVPEAPEPRRAPPAGSESQRRCLATGEVRPKSELLRFVVGPEDRLVFDLSGRLPGRGLWVSPDRTALKRAIDKKLFARAARQSVVVPDDLARQVETAMRARCLDLVGLARRAGQVVNGFEKVKEQLAKGQAALLIQARDAAPDGRDKLRALGRAVRADLPVIEIFDSTELAAILGRDIVVHLTVAPGGLADRILLDSNRLAAYCDAAGAIERDDDA